MGEKLETLMLMIVNRVDTMTKEAQYTIKNAEWHYLRLDISPDPIIFQNETLAKEYQDIEIDSLTWKSVILASLSKMYGNIGEASHFDILLSRGKSSVIRVQIEDKEKFINSLLANTFKLNKYYGGSITAGDVNCYVKVIKHGNFLGLVAGEPLS